MILLLLVHTISMGDSLHFFETHQVSSSSEEAINNQLAAPGPFPELCGAIVCAPQPLNRVKL